MSFNTSSNGNYVHWFHGVNNHLQQQQMLSRKRAWQREQQTFFPAKRPRFVASVKMLPRRPSCELLHREPHFQALNAALMNPLSHRAIDMAITGTAGVGKTELVLNFVASHVDEFQHVLWINAESKETAESCFLEVGKMLEIEVNQNQVHVPLLINKIYSLCSECSCLVVFDNAANPEMLQEFLPPFHFDKSSMFTVVTSQFNGWDCETQLEVQCFSPEQSQQFLISHLGNVKDTEAQMVSEMLGNLPLALQIAVSFIKYQEKLLGYKWSQNSIQNFICHLKSSPLQFLKYQLSTSENISYSKPLMNIFDNALKYMNEEKYGILAYCNSKRISFVRNYYPLKKFSILSQVLDSNYFNISPIWQTVIRQQHSTHERKCQIAAFLKYFFMHITFCKEDSVHSFINSKLDEHVEVVWDYAKEFPDLIEKYSLIPLAYANEQLRKRKCSACLEFIERQIESYEQLLGCDHEHFLKIHLPYVSSLYVFNQFKKVLEICSKILLKLKKYDTTYLDVLHIKSLVLYNLNNLDESFSIAKLVYTSQQHLSLKTSISKKLDTLELLCAIICKKYLEDTSNALLPTYWMSLMTKKIKDNSSHEYTVYFLPRVEKYFKSIDQVDKMLFLYDKLQSSLELNQDIKKSIYYRETNLLNKAKFLCDVDRLQESWEIYVKVHHSINATLLKKEYMKQRLEVLTQHCKEIQEERIKGDQ